MRLFTVLILLGFTACSQSTKKYMPDKRAKLLNDSAMKMSMHVQSDSDYEKIISLLDQAINIDSNFLTAYNNKISFHIKLKQYPKALETSKLIMKIRPANPETYVSIGLLYELNGDSITSNKYFKTALTKYDNVLDTMDIKSKAYDMYLVNKAVDMIFSGQQTQGDNILSQLYNKQKDEIYKEYINSFMNKSKKELINNIFNLTEQISNPK